MEGASQEEEDVPPSNQQEWIETQDLLKRKLILDDDFEWKRSFSDLDSDDNNKKDTLKFIGGVDISFLKEDPCVACAALVILDAITLQVVHEEFDVVQLQVPYVPGFLAFREAPSILNLLERMRNNASPFFPQLLMVDGNGILHPRGFGLACHIGVLSNLPTIGIGKNLHEVDGLRQSEVKHKFAAREYYEEQVFQLIGESGKLWGAALRSCIGLLRPIYVSVGHRISLGTAIKITRFCCKFRVPEPIRQADIRSKVVLQSKK